MPKLKYDGDRFIEYHIRDCLEGMRKMDDNSIDLVLTDPPYGISQTCNLTASGQKNYGKVYFGDWDGEFPYEILPEILRICRGSFYIFTPHQALNKLSEWADENKLLQRVLWWIKTNPTRRNGDVYWSIPGEHIFFAKFPQTKFNAKYEIGRHETPIVTNGRHPTEKPLSLIMKYILASSDVGDTVFDPFLGSGTTLKACQLTGRNGIGFEISKEYESVIRKRCSISKSKSGNLYIRGTRKLC